MNSQPDDWIFIILNVTPVAALFVATWHVTVYDLMPGVVAQNIGACALDCYGTRPSLVVACPEHEMIKAWPRPVQKLWSSDELDWGY